MNVHKSAGSIRRVLEHTVWLEKFQAIEFDHMPVLVATEMLCAPKARMTNRERKECARARELRYSATPARIAKAVASKLEARFSHASLTQLGKWNRRARAQRQLAQEQYQVLAKQLDKLHRVEEQTPVLNYMGALAKKRQAELDILADRLTLLAELTFAEIQKRISCATK